MASKDHLTLDGLNQIRAIKSVACRRSLAMNKAIL